MAPPFLFDCHAVLNLATNALIGNTSSIALMGIRLSSLTISGNAGL